MYHGVENDSDKAKFRPLDLSENSIMSEIEFYIRQGYQLRTHIDSSCPGLVVTFDDGNRNIKDLVIKISNQFNVRPIIAICPGVIEQQQPFWFEEVYARLLLSQNYRKYPICSDCDTGETAMQRIMQKYFSEHAIQSDDLLAEIRMVTADVSVEQLTQHPAVHNNLNWDELAELVANDRCLIAVHTLFHDAVTHMNSTQFTNDLAQCSSLIKANLGVDCEHFIYPFGDKGEDWEADILSKFGYKYIYLMDERINSNKNAQGRISRITGRDMNKALGYYQYLWKQRHSHPDLYH